MNAGSRVKTSVATNAASTRLATRLGAVTVTVASAPSSGSTGLQSGRPFLSFNLRDVSSNLDASRGSVCARLSASFYNAVVKMAWEPFIEAFAFAVQFSTGVEAGDGACVRVFAWCQ